MAMDDAGESETLVQNREMSALETIPFELLSGFVEGSP